MSDLEPGRRSGLSRRTREDRAYKLVLSTGGLLVISIALFVLAVLGIVGGGYAVVAALLAAGSGFMLRRTLGR
jgi:hypothetical protein